jgi:hypothetical protein
MEERRMDKQLHCGKSGRVNGDWMGGCKLFTFMNDLMSCNSVEFAKSEKKNFNLNVFHCHNYRSHTYMWF